MEKYIYHILNCPQDPCAQGAGHGDHLLAVAADGVWVRREHPCVVLQGKWYWIDCYKQLVTCVILIGRTCAVSHTNLYWSFLMYTSYFLLFAR